MKLKSFVAVVGPRKSATTWLYDYFRQHPGCSLPKTEKEIYFFDKHFKKGKEWLDKKYTKKDALRMEIAPSYFSNSEVPTRMRSLYDCPRVIICLREPVDRLISDYRHHVRYGHTKKTILEAITEPNDLYPSACYSEQVQMWKDKLGDDNVLVVYYDDFSANKQDFVNDICMFAGLGELDISDELLQHVSNPSSNSINPLIAKYATKISFLLKSVNLSWLLRAAKVMGIRDLIYSKVKKTNKSDVSKEELIELGTMMENEIERYHARAY